MKLPFPFHFRSRPRFPSRFLFRLLLRFLFIDDGFIAAFTVSVPFPFQSGFRPGSNSGSCSGSSLTVSSLRFCSRSHHKPSAPTLSSIFPSFLPSCFHLLFGLSPFIFWPVSSRPVAAAAALEAAVGADAAAAASAAAAAAASGGADVAANEIGEGGKRLLLCSACRSAPSTTWPARR